MMAAQRPQQHYDVAIAGAGPAGAACALRLARAGMRVALFERSWFDDVRSGESLAPEVRPLLEELGVWQSFMALAPLPSHGTRSVWGDAVPREHSHLSTPWNCGWHVDRCDFDRMLAEAAVDAGAALHCGTTTVEAQWSAAHWDLTLRAAPFIGASPSLLRTQARVFIDATGRSTRWANVLGASRAIFDRLVGISVTFNAMHERRQGHLLIEAVPEGWWYSAPLPNRRLMVMLMTDSDLCHRHRLATPEGWRRHLHHTTFTAEGSEDWHALSEPCVISAISQRSCRTEYRLPWLAVGDAALSVDPLSGSGVVRALRMADACARTTMEQLQGRASAAIRHYETERDAECTTYLYERAMNYGHESRWAHADFWRRRLAAARQIDVRAA